MKRKEFLKFMGLGIAGAATLPVQSLYSNPELLPSTAKKFWTWIGTDLRTKEEGWKERFAAMKSAGIDAILPQIYDSHHAYFGSSHLPVKKEWLEMILPLAKSEGLEVHAWMWTMPCNVPKIHQDHPEWFVVNRTGESSLEKPAYVNYYKFLCASYEGVHEFVQKTVRELGQYTDLDGIHLDYVRYPDVILPVDLWKKYDIVQDKEYPQYDYCYCDLCRKTFKENTGLDSMDIEDPASHKPWLQFRYDNITRLVNQTLLPVAQEAQKQMTAAVFPNWNNVRQQWSHWNLDGYLPMLYNQFYQEGVDWIGKQVNDRIREMHNQSPIYSGLFVRGFSSAELEKAIRCGIENGAEGASFFSSRGLERMGWDKVAEVIKSFK